VSPPISADGVGLVLAAPTEGPVETSNPSPGGADVTGMDAAAHARPDLPTIEASSRPPVADSRFVDDVYDLIVSRLSDERARRGW
jgi:hypothetical protein